MDILHPRIHMKKEASGSSIEPEASKYIGWQCVSLRDHPRETARGTWMQDLHKR